MWKSTVSNADQRRWWWTGLAGALVLTFVVQGLVGAKRLLAQSKKPLAKVSVRQRIGIGSLRSDLRNQVPVGRGITVGHVEGQAGDYVPNMKGKGFDGVGYTFRSGPSKVNGHAHSTAKKIYGQYGLAPGINDVNFFTVAHWLNGAVLRTGTAQAPMTDGRRLFTHSWISNPIGHQAQPVLRRVDYLIDEHDIIMTVGVNNGKGSKVPALLASAYNVIAVGVASGQSSGGYTRYEGRGRCKPDIVAPHGTTSGATAIVAAVAARLLETADRMATIRPEAGRSEVIKAVLLAGAKKSKQWAPQAGKPLDEHLGAGMVQFGHSYSILRARSDSSEHTPYGGVDWEFGVLSGEQHKVYGIEITEPVKDVCIAVVWNRRIDGQIAADLITGASRWLDTPRLADFDLQLRRVEDHDEQTENSLPSVAAESASRIDNVELIFLKRLPAGRYQIVVNRRDLVPEGWDYAVAWRMEQEATPVTE